MKVLIESGKQLHRMWKASIAAASRSGKITAVQAKGLDDKFRSIGGLRTNPRPQEAYRAIVESHNAVGVSRLLPTNIKIQEAGMGAIQASKHNRKPMQRLANKAESQNQKMRRLGFKIKKDPKVREY
tara:strand:+ start:560 stop:940 length:381 start_codon:yes stop_codon:yes gene_type:complete